MDSSKSNTKSKMFQDALVNEKDFLKEIIQDYCQNLLEEQMMEHIGAEKYQRVEDSRAQKWLQAKDSKDKGGHLKPSYPSGQGGQFLHQSLWPLPEKRKGNCNSTDGNVYKGNIYKKGFCYYRKAVWDIF